jgi:hypothetical protein
VNGLPAVTVPVTAPVPAIVESAAIAGAAVTPTIVNARALIVHRLAG